ncbi:MAG: TRAP transporter large permease [Moorellales bacterium]
MEWWLICLLLLGGLLGAFLVQVPVGLAFLLVDLIAMYLLMGSSAPFRLLDSVFDSVTKFSLTPIPLFILMGELFFHTGLVSRALDAIEMWISRVPGRLAVAAMAAGVAFAAVSGSVMANTAMLGAVLVPEMLRRGYHKSLITGPITASGTLGMLIPPSTLTVVFASVAGISVGKMLIAGILPGLLLAVLFIGYICAACILRPGLAPPPEESTTPMGTRLLALVRDLLPLLAVAGVVVGSIFLGVATPTEAAALGAVGAAVLALAYGKLTSSAVFKSLLSAAGITSMVLLIVAGSTAFSQVLAYSGASRKLLQAALELPFSPTVLVVWMLVIVFILGLFLEEMAIIMITTPIFMPLVEALQVDPIWFGTLMLLMLENSLLTPPVGMVLYAMKGMVPESISMIDIWRSVVPYILLGFIVVALILFCPPLATWLPGLAR